MLFASCNNEIVDPEEDFDNEEIVNNLIGSWTLEQSYYIINEERRQPVDEGDSPYYVRFMESEYSIFKIEYSSKAEKLKPITHVSACTYISSTEVIFSSFSNVIRNENDRDPVRMKYTLSGNYLTLALELKKDNSVLYRIYRKK